MEMLWVLAALTGVVLAVVGWVMWRSHSGGPIEPLPPASRDGPKRAMKPTWGKVVVVPDRAHACRAVLEIEGREFPNADAPRLPLPNCTFSNCKCYFVPARERRLRLERRCGLDRRTGLRFEPGTEGDRRSGKDRRHGSHYDWDHKV
ncbi:MAG: hypothetical protein MUE39_05525 [Gammaproteobacteria bacterium]|jgi:hypothetical protein|nr:hypothetical protein [Gammaproteobacteria bacterium]